MNGWQRQLVFLLVIANVGIHYGDIKSWIPTLGILFVGWRWLADLYRIPCPGRLGAAIFAAIGAVAVWAEYANLIGDPASTALLIIMISLKTFEIRGYRDLMIVTYLCLLLLMAKLLSSQTLSITIFMFVDVVVILSLMLLYHLPHKTRGLPWRRASRLVLQSAPLFIALFLIFPRFNFSLFKRQSDPVAMVGFSGQVRPGSMAKLTQSDQIAFRAFFRGDPPPSSGQLYWRGAVLSLAKGLNWDPSPEARKLLNQTLTENLVEIMIESGDSSWLFTLDWPLAVQMGSGFRQEQVEESTGRSFHLRSPLVARETYALSYSRSSRDMAWNQDEVKASLEIEAPSRRLRNLLRTWQRAYGQPQVAVKILEDYFVEQKFNYSLNAPESDSLDEFLFQNKTGYCEHFAGATATLLRHLRIPSRVIVGYHGGVPSLMRDYVLVYQRDAHAWVEYWDQNRQAWQRLDPTSWVAKDRVAFLDPNLIAWQNNPVGRWLGNDFAQYWVQGQLIFDQAEILWLTFMLRYDFNYQQSILNAWGFKNITRGRLFMFSGLVVLVLCLLIYLGTRFVRRRAKDPQLKLYLQLCEELAAAGLLRQSNEGPLSLLRRAQQRWPQHSALFEELFGLWIALRYESQKPDADWRERWRQLSKKLTLQLNAGAQQD